MFGSSVHEICLILFMAALYMHLAYTNLKSGMLPIFSEKKEKLQTALINFMFASLWNLPLNGIVWCIFNYMSTKTSQCIVIFIVPSYKE